MKPIYLTLAVLLISTSVLAMNAPKPKPGVVTKKKMYEAALVLLDTMNKDGIMQKQLGIAIDEQLKGMNEIPCADRIMPQLRDIMNNAINYGALRNDLANVYANNFTLEELNWMVDFY
jgi:hypothetical protein